VGSAGRMVIAKGEGCPGARRGKVEHHIFGVFRKRKEK